MAGTWTCRNTQGEITNPHMAASQLHLHTAHGVLSPSPSTPPPPALRFEDNSKQPDCFLKIFYQIKSCWLESHFCFSFSGDFRCLYPGLHAAPRERVLLGGPVCWAVSLSSHLCPVSLPFMLSVRETLVSLIFLDSRVYLELCPLHSKLLLFPHASSGLTTML